MNSHAISAASVSVGHGPGAGGNEGTAQDRGTAAPDSNLTGIDAPQEPPQPAAHEKDSAIFSGARPGSSGYVPSASSTGEEDPGANPDPNVPPPRTDPSPLPDPPPPPQPPPPEIDPPPPTEDPQPGHELPVMPQPIAT